MKIVIYIFLGLFLIISGGELKDLLRFNLMPLLCNIIGCTLMGYALLMIWREKNKLEDRLFSDIRSLNEKLPSNNEFKQNFDIIKAISERQEKIANYTCDLDGNIITLVNYIKEKMPVTDLLVHIKEILETQNTENKSALMDLNKVIQKETEEIYKITAKIDELKTESKNRSKETNNVIEKIDNNIKACADEELQSLVNILEKLENMNKLPLEINSQIEKLIYGLNLNYNNIVEKMDICVRNSEEHIEELTAKMKKEFMKMIDDFADKNDEVVEELEKLSGQYEVFERTINGIVENMTLMSAEDRKFLEGLFNG
ncbi:MAG: hypothetical protein ACTTKH_05785 [Treponema sp.]